MTAMPRHDTSTTEAQYLNDDVPNSYGSIDDARRKLEHVVKTKMVPRLIETSPLLPTDKICIRFAS